MNAFIDAIVRLFSSDGFVPRRVCGLWPDWLVWEHVVGNALVWLAYLAMPLMIWRLGTRRPEWTPFQGIVLAFALFIGLCGLGHFLDMIAFFRPMYRLSGHVLIVTGLASWWTAWSLRKAWPAFMAMKSPAELERVIAERTRELALANVGLREGEARFRQLADAMPIIVWAARPDVYVDYYNERWYEFTGRPRAGGGFESWIPVIHPDDLPGCIDAWHQAIETGESYRVEHRFKNHKTGEYRWHVGRALPARDDSGQITRWFVTASDIHEERLQAEVLRESEARQRRAMAAARLAHREWDLLSNQIIYQDFLARLFNRPDDQPFADLVDCLAFVHPDDHVVIRAAADRSMTLGIPYEVDHRVIWPDGSIHWLGSLGGVVFGEDGTPLRMVGVNLDITDRKESEAQIRLLNEGLEQRVRERTAELGQQARLIDQAHDAIMIRSREGVIFS